MGGFFSGLLARLNFGCLLSPVFFCTTFDNPGYSFCHSEEGYGIVANKTTVAKLLVRCISTSGVPIEKRFYVEQAGYDRVGERLHRR